MKGADARTMAELTDYKDLTSSPLDGDSMDKASTATVTAPARTTSSAPVVFPADINDAMNAAPEGDAEFSSNVRTLIRLVGDLPEGVTKQTGAQIIRLTMEAMGISMEDVLTEAQSAQSEMLDAVRANIKKIEEYKTVIRKLESDIKFYQGKANELSEIIDLFILSNTSPKLPAGVDDLDA